ncbi:PTS glucose transporter subunit IIA [Bhargavaea cecembensis]|uniref:PTS glucose transporter subunit IIA n=1 Tax=Bhargavaea cecembensis TaxID=394098 RepID=A0A161SJ78_9BACL|nr:PTS glucose transporter subunit IIA [Bhargavaea cecembensis]KZE37283.1 PTS glucose transporter subunit IIA [Bhargavaea cecembensis]
MLSNLFKKKDKEEKVVAPVSGQLMPIDQVPDPVFSGKMMGEGIAVMPDSGSVVAPVDGTVVMVADTGHAIGIRSAQGTEYLIHIGLDTVALKGEGFNVLVRQDDKVTAGQPLIEADWTYLGENAKSTVTPIVVTNGEGKTVRPEAEGTCTAGETLVLTVTAG